MTTEVTDVFGAVYHETEKAYLFSDVGERAKGVWVAKSQVQWEPDGKTAPDGGETGTLTLPAWMASQKGLV